MENEGHLAYATKDPSPVLLRAYLRTDASGKIINHRSQKINFFNEKRVKNRTYGKCGKWPAKPRFFNGMYEAMPRGGFNGMAGILESRFEIIQYYSHFLKSDKNLLNPGLMRVLRGVKGLKNFFVDFCKNRGKSLTSFSGFFKKQEVLHVKMV